MSDAQCPSCGYQTLNLVAGTLVCGRAECGYEHLVTQTMPIIVQPTNPD
jgi:hypothetical protein